MKKKKNVHQKNMKNVVMARPATPSNNSQLVYTGVSRMFMAAASAASIKTDLVERLRASVPDFYMAQMERHSCS